MDDKKGFFQKCKGNLAYRIMAVILVTTIPLCLVMITIAMVTIHSSFLHMQEQAQRQMEVNLNRMETDILRIEDYAGEFVNEYMAELNAEGGFSDELIPYDMMNDLQRLFSHTGLKGAVYLVDRINDRCMVRGVNTLYQPQELELMRDYISENIAARFEGLTLDGHELIRREYNYQNARAGFVVDIPASLVSLFSEAFEDEVITYIQNGQSIFQYFADGSIQTAAEDIPSSGQPSRLMDSIVWEGCAIPLSVSVFYPWTIMLASIPALDWVLLLIAGLCLLLLPLIWFVLKKDVLEPVERLTHALQEMLHGNEGYRIDEHNDGYADEMLYLFESFDAAAAEVQRSKEKDIKMVKAELDNLRLQVNPHMLLNSYNMIFALAQSKKFDTIQEYSLHLVNYFRYVLRKTDECFR